MKAASGFFVCICPDTFLLQKQLQALIQERFAKETIERHLVWADEGLTPRFWDALSLQGFTTQPRVIIIRHMEAFCVADLKKLSAELAKARSFVWIILCIENAWEKNQAKIPAHIAKLACYTFAEKNKWMWRSPPITTRSMPAYVRGEAKQYGLVFNEAVLADFCAALNSEGSTPEAANIDTELRKLALLVPDGNINEESLALITKQVHFDVFAFLRAVQKKQTQLVWQTVVELQNTGEDPLFLLLALLQREARTFCQILVRESVWIPPNEQENKRQLAQKLGIQGVVSFFTALHFAEYAVKSGNLTTDQALEKLLDEVAQIFS